MRRIVTESIARAQGPGQRPDDYMTRLLKYVPAETNSLYVAAMGALHTAGSTSGMPLSTIMWLIFLGCFVFNILYMWRVAKETNPIRLGISTGAFVVWAIALGDVVAAVSWWYELYGSLILLFYTAAAGLYLGK